MKYKILTKEANAWWVSLSEDEKVDLHFQERKRKEEEEE